MPKIKNSNENKKVNKPLFDVDLVKEVRAKAGACNQTLLMRIAANDFVENYAVDAIVDMVKKIKGPQKIARLEAQIAALKAE